MYGLNVLEVLIKTVFLRLIDLPVVLEDVFFSFFFLTMYFGGKLIHAIEIIHLNL